MDGEKHAQNDVFLIKKWHLPDIAVHKSIFQAVFSPNVSFRSTEHQTPELISFPLLMLW